MFSYSHTHSHTASMIYCFTFAYASVLLICSLTFGSLCGTQFMTMTSQDSHKSASSCCCCCCCCRLKPSPPACPVTMTTMGTTPRKIMKDLISLSSRNYIYTALNCIVETDVIAALDCVRRRRVCAAVESGAGGLS